MDGNGDPVDLSQRRTEYYKTVDGEKVWGTAKAVLTAEEAAEYTIQNVLGGNDNWQPELLTEACAAPGTCDYRFYDIMGSRTLFYQLCHS